MEACSLYILYSGVMYSAFGVSSAFPLYFSYGSLLFVGASALYSPFPLYCSGPRACRSYGVALRELATTVGSVEEQELLRRSVARARYSSPSGSGINQRRIQVHANSQYR